MKYPASICLALVLAIPMTSPAFVGGFALTLVAVGAAHAEPVKPGTAKKGCAITLQGPGAGQSVVYDDGYSFSVTDKATGKTHTYTCKDGVWTETVSKISAPLGAVDPVLINAIGIRATKEQVSGACDAVKGVPNLGSNGAGYGCYKSKTDVMVVCSSDGACIGFSPLKSHAKTLRGFLGLGIVEVSPNVGNTSKSGAAPQPPAPPPPID